MLENLQNPPEPFADIIRTHFKLKAKSLTKQLDDWVAKDDGRELTVDSGGMPHQGAGGGSPSFRNDVKELKRLLQEL